jgi:hypothetical protein
LGIFVLGVPAKAVGLYAAIFYAALRHKRISTAIPNAARFPDWLQTSADN